MTRTAYVAVDVQYDFLEGGALGVDGGTAAAQRLAKHLQENQYDELITTQDWHIDPGTHWSDTPDFVDTWPVHCAAGTEGAALYEDMQAVVDNTEPAKYTKVLKGQYIAAYSGFEGATEDGQLLVDVLRSKNVTTVHIGGIATDHCVRATALHALEAGFDVIIHTDHIAAVGQETGQAALDEVVAAGATLTQDEEK